MSNAKCACSIPIARQIHIMKVVVLVHNCIARAQKKVPCRQHLVLAKGLVHQVSLLSRQKIARKIHGGCNHLRMHCQNILNNTPKHLAAA